MDRRSKRQHPGESIEQQQQHEWGVQQQQQQAAHPDPPTPQQLPSAVIDQIVCSGGTQRHQHGVLACVSSEWRAAVMHHTTHLSVGLTSDTGAASLAAWLSQHASGLKQLEMATVGLFGRHCEDPTRLRLFQALQCCTPGAAAAAAAGAGPENDAHSQQPSNPPAAVAAETTTAAAAAETMLLEEPAAAALEAAPAAGPAAAPAAVAAAVKAYAARGGPMSLQQLRQLAQLPALEQHQHPHQHQHQQQQQLQLTRLDASMRFTPADCAAIACLPAPHLVTLELTGSRTRRLGPDGVRALAALTQLTRLQLSTLGVLDADVVMLTKSLPGLVQLALPGNNIGTVGAAGIAKHCTRLQLLDLSVNRLTGCAVQILCSSLPNLLELSLAGNPGSCAGSSLQDLQHLTRLQRLSVASTGLCNQGLAAVAAALPQLKALDASNNRISKVEPLTGLVGLTGLVLNRSALQINAGKVLGGLPLHSLAVFDALSGKAVASLAAGPLAQHLTSLTLGTDPSLNPEGTVGLPLAKTRTCTTLFGALAEAGRLQVLSVACTGLGDAQAKCIGNLCSLTALNLSYNELTPHGVRFLGDLTNLQRLELRAMRPELTDEVADELTRCSRLQLLDLAHNDLTSEGIKQLGCPGLARLRHLDLRNNAQVEKWAVLAAAAHLTAITHLNLQEVSDVSARAFKPAQRPRTGAAPGSADATSPGGAAAAAAGATGAPGAAAATALPAGSSGAGPSSNRRKAAGAAARGAAAAAAAVAVPKRPHADLWAALPELVELLVEGQYGPNVGRGGRVMVSCG